VSRILFRMSLAMDVRCATYRAKDGSREFWFNANIRIGWETVWEDHSIYIKR